MSMSTSTQPSFSVRPVRAPMKEGFRGQSPTRSLEQSVELVAGDLAGDETVLNVTAGGGGASSSQSLSKPAWSYEDIFDHFSKYDHNASGTLDVFELSNAVGGMIGRSLGTAEVVRLIEMYSVEGSNVLTLFDFLRLFQEHDFTMEPDEELGEGVYELEFPEKSLNIKVNNDATYGTIVVTAILDDNLVYEDRIRIGDTVIAVNGAPLGKVEDHKELAGKLSAKKLSRPVKITLMMSAQHRVDATGRQRVHVGHQVAANALHRREEQVLGHVRRRQRHERRHRGSAGAELRRGEAARAACGSSECSTTTEKMGHHPPDDAS